MYKPRNYDNTSAYGDYEALEPGGHICVIQKVEETTSRSQRPMLKIFLDTAQEDTQPGYYMKRGKSDQKPADKRRWGCIVYQLTEDDDGFCSRGLKSFITSVEESNPGFTPQWDDSFAQGFKGRKVGGIFRREQFETKDGDLKWSVKCFAFRSVKTVKEGVEVPKDKYLDSKRGSSVSYAAPSNGFSELDDGDGEIPF